MAEPAALASPALKLTVWMASVLPYCTDCDAGPLSRATSSVKLDHRAAWTKYSHSRSASPREKALVL